MLVNLQCYCWQLQPDPEVYRLWHHKLTYQSYAPWHWRHQKRGYMGFIQRHSLSNNWTVLIFCRSRHAAGSCPSSRHEWSQSSQCVTWRHQLHPQIWTLEPRQWLECIRTTVWVNWNLWKNWRAPIPRQLESLRKSQWHIIGLFSARGRTRSRRNGQK